MCARGGEFGTFDDGHLKNTLVQAPVQITLWIACAPAKAEFSPLSSCSTTDNGLTYTIHPPPTKCNHSAKKKETFPQREKKSQQYKQYLHFSHAFFALKYVNTQCG